MYVLCPYKNDLSTISRKDIESISMDCEAIKERNLSTLRLLLEKYNIKESVEDLLNYFSSVYIHKDFKQKRVRLLGIKEDYIVDNDGEKHKTGKKKTVQLYVLSRRMIQSLPETTVYEISRDLSVISLYFEELKLIKKIETTENLFDNIVSMNSLTPEEFAKMQE